MDPPGPILSIAIQPKTKADRQKLGFALARLLIDHPVVCLHTDPRSGTVVIGAMKEMHLEVIVDRLSRHFQVDAHVGPPQPVYKETVTRAADGEMKYASRTWGENHYAHVKLHLHPGERGSGYVFESHILTGTIPAAFIKPVEDGVRAALADGVLAGHPVEDVRVELYDGSYHAAYSSETAFRIAGAMAFQDAARKAAPVLLEPVMQVEVFVTGDEVANVLGNLSQRRARIRSHERRAGTQVINALVPISETVGYATDLRVRTHGRAKSTMEFAGYQVRRGDIGNGDDDDRTSSVREPRKPPLTGNTTAIALPEPDFDG
jgi:elongation factor G